MCIDFEGKYYSTKEAAEKLEISERRVRQLLAKKLIKGFKFSNTWLIPNIAYADQRGFNNGQS